VVVPESVRRFIDLCDWTTVAAVIDGLGDHASTAAFEDLRTKHTNAMVRDRLACPSVVVPSPLV
jgi:hypothetical protein